ncbi:MAG TPA: efflux RND transporter periplasmic adaptor subunit [Spirochaetia bacterium]|nr:efflux RND transporter periplasmic adaptor subunit [Spirochaetia bacterium]
MAHVKSTLILLAGGALLASGCGGSDPAPETGYVEQVQTVTVAAQEITPEIRSFGTITYFAKADVSVTTSGLIRTLAVEEGEAVRQGQVIAAIENIQLEIQRKRTLSQISQARAALELAQAKLKEAKLQVEARLVSVLITELDVAQKKIELDDLERVLKNKEKLYAVGGMSDEEIHAARMQFAAAQNKYDLAVKSLQMQRIGLRDEDVRAAGYTFPLSEKDRVEILKTINTETLGAEVKVAAASLNAALMELEAVDQLLAETTVRAPVTGIIGMRYLEPGERVQPEAKLYTVLDLSRVYAVFPIPEGDAAFVTEGMPVEITVDALGDRKLEAKIHLISPLVDPQTGNITVKALLPNPGLQLKPGMFVRTRVISGASRKALLVPKTCLLKKEGKTGELLTVVRGRVFLNKVQLGIEKEDLVEITTGISEGDTVVDAPSPLLKEGQNVEISAD